MSQRSDYAAVIEMNESLLARVIELERQLAWFRKQMFGEKSERRLVDANPDQLALEALLGECRRGVDRMSMTMQERGVGP